MESSLPYEQQALDAAWEALRHTADERPIISEQTIDTWLDLVYATPWGQQWAATARQARDAFTDSFLTFRKPFEDRSEFAARLDESFDTVHVLHSDDVDEYRRLTDRDDGDLLLAEGLLIPLRFGQATQLRRHGRAHLDRSLGLLVVDLPYSPETGLHLDPDENQAATVLVTGTVL